MGSSGPRSRLSAGERLLVAHEHELAGHAALAENRLGQADRDAHRCSRRRAPGSGLRIVSVARSLRELPWLCGACERNHNGSSRKARRPGPLQPRHSRDTPLELESASRRSWIAFPNGERRSRLDEPYFRMSDFRCRVCSIVVVSDRGTEAEGQLPAVSRFGAHAFHAELNLPLMP